jgi:hypothetical protein
MKIDRIAVSALAVILSAAGVGIGGTRASAQEMGWDAPPRELNEYQQRGFHDGIEGARKDFENHRRPDVENRDEFRRPNVPMDVRDAYLDGFRRGYQVGVNHFFNAGGGPMRQAPPPPPPGGEWHGVWENREFNEMERRGFEAGRAAAQNDIAEHYRLDPANRAEYRDPQLPPEAADQYRAGFRRGYEEQVSQTFGVTASSPWDYVPDRFSEIGRRGFHDGVEGARKDIENHRHPDPYNRDEYRRPNVTPEYVDDYREGFRLGYERAIAHLLNGAPVY